MTNPFLTTTAVAPIGPGSYSASIDDRWNLTRLPQGGIVSALVLRAMEDMLGDAAQGLRTLHSAFIGQVAHGPVTVDVEVLRRGRSMSHLRGEVRNPGAARGHLTTAIFGSSRQGFTFTDLAPPPDLPAPADCPSFRDPPPPGVVPFEPLPFWRLIEGRSAMGHPPWEEYVPGRAEVAMWYRFDDAPFLDDGTIDPLALVVLADTMPGAVREKIGAQGRRWFAPSVDLTVHILDRCRSEWLLAHNRARFAGDGYASADMALWDCGAHGTETGRLVAYATQLFLFTFTDADGSARQDGGS